MTNFKYDGNTGRKIWLASSVVDEESGPTPSDAPTQVLREPFRKLSRRAAPQTGGAVAARASQTSTDGQIGRFGPALPP